MIIYVKNELRWVFHISPSFLFITKL